MNIDWQVKRYLSENAFAWAPGTLKNHQKALRRWIREVKASTPKDAPTRYLSARVKEASPNAIRNECRMIAKFCEWAKANEFAGSNHFAKLRLPRPAAAAPRQPWLAHEKDRLLATAHAIDDYYSPHSPVEPPTYWPYAITCAWETGMRISDISLLEWTEIDWQARTIRRISHKTRKLGRWIDMPISETLYTMLLSMKDEASKSDNLSQHVCPEMAVAYHGGQEATKTACHQFQRLKTWAGFPESDKRTFHCFRHSFITRLISNGVNPAVISSMTGQSIGVIMQYAHPDIDTKRKAMETLEHT